MRPLQDDFIFEAGKIFSGMENVVACLPQNPDAGDGKIFVGHKAHGSPCGRGVKRFFFQTFRREGEAGLQGFGSQARIIFKDLLARPAVGEQAQDKIHREPRAFDHGLADQDFRVGVNVFMPVQHEASKTQLRPAVNERKVFCNL